MPKDLTWQLHFTHYNTQIKTPVIIHFSDFPIQFFNFNDCPKGSELQYSPKDALNIKNYYSVQKNKQINQFTFLLVGWADNSLSLKLFCLSFFTLSSSSTSSSASSIAALEAEL